ncbi:MAG: nucleoside hydrolase [Synechococcales cyanobacterium RM1_1_8]|nr:nucleoside hydrolase [Synechococcales cyanobacterium RM1_1_8]
MLPTPAAEPLPDGPRRLIIDCDPGIDDAVALLLALASPQLEILGITTVAGNVSLETTSTNARCICELASHPEVQIFPGCPRPLVRPSVIAAQVHGENGLGGVRLAPPQMPLQPIHGVDFLRDTLRCAPAPVTLASLGPLTNLATALIQAPQIAERLELIVIMGGAVGAGNVTAAAEFNFYADPHAAQVVLHTAADYGVPVVVIPLDVTHGAIATPARRQALRDLNAPAGQNPIGQTVAAMLENYGLREQQARGFTGPPLHDPCVIAYLLQPDLFETEAIAASIEIQSPLTQGRLVVDRSGELGLLGRIHLATAIDADGFYRLLLEHLGRYGGEPPTP